MNDSESPAERIAEQRMAEFARCWSAAHSVLAAYVHSAIRDRHRAEDIVQEVAEAAIRSFAEFDRQRSFVGWALGIARHRVLHHLRTMGRDRHCFGEDALIAIADAHESLEKSEHEYQDDLQRCLQRLSSRSKQFIELRYRQGCALSEISGQMNMTRNAVAVAIHRIRRTLVTCIREQNRMTDDA
ncbi:MAG: sigma-70 family RNA polymerase sigma factor [Planctomycetota bacterium]